MKVDIYARGLCSCSVCAPVEMTPEEVAEAVNRQEPTGIDSPWKLSDDAAFKGGQLIPFACADDSGRQHWLLEC